MEQPSQASKAEGYIYRGIVRTADERCKLVRIPRLSGLHSTGVSGTSFKDKEIFSENINIVKLTSESQFEHIMSRLLDTSLTNQKVKLVCFVL